MEATLSKNKTHPLDAFAWIGLLCFLSSLAFFMLARDAKNQYGSVSFGNFPEFKATNAATDTLDQHRLHGQLSVIQISEPPADILTYLRRLAQATQSGKKYLHVLIFTNTSLTGSDQWVNYWALERNRFEELVHWQESIFKNGVFLVDQNGIIRGVFDLEDKLQRLNFENAVRGIL